jgi:hypothetical protein
MGWPDNRLDMFSIETLDIPNAGNRGISRFRIFKSGAKGTLDARDQRETPAEYSLSAGYPNPFNPGTTSGDGPVRAFVTVKIYDLLGQVVETLFSGTLDPRMDAFRGRLPICPAVSISPRWRPGAAAHAKLVSRE